MDLGAIRGQVRLDIGQAVAAYAALRAQNQRTVYAMRGTGDAFVAAGARMTLAGGALLGVFGLAVAKAAEFERKMDFFQAVTGTSASQMERLNEVTLEIAQNTIYSADQMAEGMIELGKAGVSAEQVIDGIGVAMANLGAAGDIPLAQAGQIITSTIQQYDLAATDAVRVTDLLAGAANASIADIEDIGVSLKYVGGVASAAGLTFEDTATAISLLAKAGIRGSTAGTSLRQMIVSLGGATGPARDALREIGILTGENNNKFYTQSGTLKPLSKVYQILQDHLSGYNQKQKLAFLRTIFNNRALSAAAILTRDGAKGFREMNKEMAKTTAAETARKRLDNLSGDIEILKGNIETLLTNAGGPFQETLRGWVQRITELVQAFSNLPEGTQKAIFQFIAISGVVLTVGGVFLTIVGVIFRLLAAMRKFGAGVAFAVKFVRALVFVFGLIAGGAITGTVLAIAAAVIAVGAAFIIAYKKIEPFRNFVNSIGSWFMSNVVNPIMNGIGVLVEWFKLLAKDPKAAWEQLKAAAGQAVSFLGQQFAKLPGLVGQGLAALGGMIGNIVGSIVGWFASLPGRILAGIQALPGLLLAFFGRLPSMIGNVLGLLIGVGWAIFTRFFALVIAGVLGWIGMLLSLFTSLMTRIPYLIGFLVGRVIRFFLNMQARAVNLARALVTGVVRFFTQLPGRIASFVSRMASRAVSLFNTFRQRAPQIAAQLVVKFVSFISKLPGRVADFIGRMKDKAISIAKQLPGKFREFARGMANGITNGIKGIPGSVGGILGKAISAIKGKIREAFNAVKDFAGNMWKGFKSGLGINSPSLIEKQMYQITRVTGEETKKIARQTMDVQKLSKKMAATQFGVGRTTGGAAGLRSMIAAKQLAASQVASTARPGSGPRVLAQVNAPSKQQMQGVLRLTPDSRAFVEVIAQGVVDTNAEYDDVLEDM